MLDKTKKSIINKLSKLKVQKLYIQSYNECCNKCRLQIHLSVKRNPYHSLNPDKLCNVCKPKVIKIYEKIQEIIEK